jgi:hypothetical protein|tara:strand:+ start:232 stop:852 length:621 start_codon:yes stop_codon:yes gene_type:complete
MSHKRNLKYLNDNRIVYRRMPISDKPDQENECYMFYLNGTHECYELFRSKAKITTYRSLKWHLLVLWYLNPQLDQDKFEDIAYVITNKDHGFITFTIPNQLLKQIVYEVSMLDLEEPPKNRLRKVIFKYGNMLSKEEKLRIVGTLIGRSKKVHKDDIYDVMLMLNHGGWSITIAKLARGLDCSTRTIHRSMCTELKREKELLNKQL